MRFSYAVLAFLSVIPLCLVAGPDSAAASPPTDRGGSVYWRLAPEAGEAVGSFSFAPDGALRIETTCGVIEATPGVDEFGVRRVDSITGQPIPGPDAADLALFDAVCLATQGIASGIFPELADRCLVDLVNSQEPIFLGFITPATALSAVLGGSASGTTVMGILAPTAPPLRQLNRDPADGVSTSPFGPGQGLGAFLTDQQEALLGCGAFYGTDCDIDGIDLFHSEASALAQSLPHFAIGEGVATRDVPGGDTVILPGARGPTDDGFSPIVDGCTGAGPVGCNAGDPGRTGPNASSLTNPSTGGMFASELAASSYNFLVLLAGLSAGSGQDPACVPTDPFTCSFVRAFTELMVTLPPDDPTGAPQARWIWERSADYEIVSATDELGVFGDASLRVIGPEISRVAGADEGFGFAVFGSEPVEPPSCLPIPAAGVPGSTIPPVLFLYGPVPEPTANAAAAFATLTMVIMRRVRAIWERPRRRVEPAR